MGCGSECHLWLQTEIMNSSLRRFGYVRAVVLAACMGCFLARSDAEDWMHWRGPLGTGASPTAKPPIRWSNTENVKWKTPVPGLGSGSPIVVGKRVYVVSAVPLDDKLSPRSQTEYEFCLFCFDRETGEFIFKMVATTARPHQATHETNGFASASPCTDGLYVYAHFGSRGLYCYTLSGQLVWKRDDFGLMQTRNDFGEGSSPTIAGDLLIVPWDHEGQSHLYALDKRTGVTVWDTVRDEPTNWSTPLIVPMPNGESQVVMNGQNFARGYDLKTGQELWRCAGQTERPVASAVAGDGLVFVTSGFRGSFLGAFRLDGRGNLEGTPAVAWTLDRDTPDIASPLLSNGRIYFHKAKTGLISCYEAQTGKPCFQSERVDAINITYASPVAANGYVYMTGRNGVTVVIEDAPEFKQVAVNKLGEPIDATPALADKQIFIRGEKNLYCFER